MKSTKWIFLLVVGVFLFSCKVQEKENIKVKVKPRPSKFLIKKLKQNELDFTSISAKSAVAVIDSSGKKLHLKFILE